MVVTSYEIVIADVKHLQKFTWKHLIVDEGHRLKNSNCKLLRELRTIPTANKMLLTGAPSWPCPGAAALCCGLPPQALAVLQTRTSPPGVLPFCEGNF